MLSKEVSSTILKVFGMTRPGIEPRSLGPLANTLPTRPMSRLNETKQVVPLRINGNEEVVRFSQSFRSQASSSEAVYCHNEDTISFWPIDGTLTGTTTLGQRRSGINGNEGVVHFIISRTLTAGRRDFTPLQRCNGLDLYNHYSPDCWAVEYID